MIFLLSGCRTTKVKTSPDSEMKSLSEHTLKYEALSARLKLELTTPDKELSARAVLKMRNNDIIQISVQPFPGIEAFKIELTKDSLKLIDRLNKCYMSESYETVKGKTAVDFNFHSLQALLSNSLFTPEAQSSTKDMTALTYRFTTGRDQSPVSITIKPSPMKMTAHLRSDEKDKATVTLLFSEPETNARITADSKIPAGYRQITFSQIIKSLEIK
jgi:hypothetical protein